MATQPHTLAAAADEQAPLQRLDWMEGLRGLAVVAVLVHHLLTPNALRATNGFLDLGVFGVVVFFCISGYIIPYSVLRLRERAALRFAVARMFRLYPAYWLSLLIAVWAFHPGAHQLALNVTMAQRFLGERDAIGVYWTLQVELIFYAIIGLLLATRSVLRRGVYPVLALTFAVLAVAMAAGRYELDRKFPLVPFTGLAVMFAATTWFMHLNHGLMSRARVLRFTAGVYGLLCVAFVLGYAKNWGYHETPTPFCLMYLVAPLVFMLAQRSAMRSKMLGFLGRISYPIYLFHVPVIALVGLYLFKTIGGVGDVLVELPLIVLLATAIHYAVEKPFVRWGKLVIGRQGS